MMGHRSNLNGGEIDAFTRWRHVMNWKAGERAMIKAMHHRKQRRRESKMLRLQAEMAIAADRRMP